MLRAILKVHGKNKSQEVAGGTTSHSTVRIGWSCGLIIFYFSVFLFFLGGGGLVGGSSSFSFPSFLSLSLSLSRRQGGIKEERKAGERAHEREGG